MNSKCTSIATVASHFTVGTWGETQQCMRCIYLVDMSPQEKGTHPLLFKGDYKQLDHKSSTPVEDWHSRPSFYSVIDVQWTPTVQGSHVSEWMTHDSPKRFCSLYTSPWLPCTNHPTSWHSGQHRLQDQSKFKTKQKWTPCLCEAYILGNICGFASPAFLPVVPALWCPFGEPFSVSERRWGWLILGRKGGCELKACTIRTLQPPGHKLGHC